MILLDTHALLWLRAGDHKLGAPHVPRFSGPTWEGDDVALWRWEQLGQGMVEIPVDGEFGTHAATLTDFHGDPADRIVVATALGGHRLVTADERIFAWTGNLDRLDARV